MNNEVLKQIGTGFTIISSIINAENSDLVTIFCNYCDNPDIIDLDNFVFGRCKFCGISFHNS